MPPRASVPRLAAEARSELPLLVFGAAGLIASTLAELSVPAVGGRLIDLYTGGSGATSSEIDGCILKLAALLVTVGLGTHVGAFLLKLAGERVVASVRKRLFSCLLHSECAFFDGRATGELVSVLTADVEAIHQAVAHQLPDCARYTCTCIVAAAHMAGISPRLTLLGATAAPFVGIFAALMGKRVTALAFDKQAQLGVTMGTATECLAAVRTIKAFGQEASIGRRYAVDVDATAGLALRELIAARLWLITNVLLGVGATLLVVRAGGQAVLAGELSAGDLISFAVYGLTTGSAANDAANNYTFAAASAARASQALELMDGGEARRRAAEERAAADEARRAARGGGAPSRLPPDGEEGSVVVVSELSFAYPRMVSAGLGQRAVDGVSFRLRPGSAAALVGPSGCGKTSVLSLLLRFYEPSNGSIRIGGVELSELPTRWLRSNVAVVFQEPTLFRGSVRDNIAFGAFDEAAAEAAGRTDGEIEREVMRAAIDANAHHFILEAGGYDAVVGERGANFSGGQRQRIAIARALLRRPRLLLLDEATASLDAKSERAVQQALSTLAAGRSTLVVAHRLSTVRDAAEIVVLEHGRVAERGTHEGLVAAGGLYARLVQLQQLQQEHQ